MRNWCWLGWIAAVTAWASPGAEAGTVVVLFQQSSEVALIDDETGEERARLAVAGPPREVAVSVDGTLAAVSCAGSLEVPTGEVVLIDIERGEIWGSLNMPRGASPWGMAWIESKPRLLYITENRRSQLLAYDVESGAIDHRMDIGSSGMRQIAITPNDWRAYVVSAQTGGATFVNLQTQDPLITKRTGRGAFGAAVDATGRQVWVANAVDDTVSIFSTRSSADLGKMQVEGRPTRLAIEPENRLVLVTCVDDGTLAVIDREAQSVIEYFPVGTERDAEAEEPTGLHGLALDAEGLRCFIADATAGEVVVVDLGMLAEGARFEVGERPTNVAWSPLDVAGE